MVLDRTTRLPDLLHATVITKPVDGGVVAVVGGTSIPFAPYHLRADLVNGGDPSRGRRMLRVFPITV